MAGKTSTKKILILVGHPVVGSLCAGIADRYAQTAAEAGHTVRRLSVADLPIDLAPPRFKSREPLADWVTKVQDDILWCQHLVIVAPLWWGGVPAALKALFDRVLLPGFAFEYGKGPQPNKLLTGRTASFIMTADTPKFWFDLALHRPLFHQMDAQILGFCGFKPVRQTLVGPIISSTPKQREKWLKEVAALGAKGG